LPNTVVSPETGRRSLIEDSKRNKNVVWGEIEKSGEGLAVATNSTRSRKAKKSKASKDSTRISSWANLTSSLAHISVIEALTGRKNRHISCPPPKGSTCPETKAGASVGLGGSRSGGGKEGVHTIFRGHAWRKRTCSAEFCEAHRKKILKKKPTRKR